MLVLSVQSWLLAPRTVEIPMSKFLAPRREGKVERVSVTDREIRGTLKPGALPAQQPGAGDKVRSLVGADQSVAAFTTTRIPGIEDSALVKELEQYKVEFSGRVESTFWRDFIFGWIVPLALMVGLWMFVMRAGWAGADPGRCPLRAQAKIYDRKELKTTFADVAGVEEARRSSWRWWTSRTPKLPTAGGRIPKGAPAGRPPGTGKTLLARAVAGGPTCRSSLPGSSSWRCRRCRSLARARSLRAGQGEGALHVFIDELDAIGKTGRRHGFRGRSRRARADPQPAAG